MPASTSSPFSDYAPRRYLSAGEAAQILGISGAQMHARMRRGAVPACRAASGRQYRPERAALEPLVQAGKPPGARLTPTEDLPQQWERPFGSSRQRICVADARDMHHVPAASVHWVITSPPSFNAKMYAPEPLQSDLGHIHDVAPWLREIGQVWREGYRVLQPGRKAFLNIMNLPARQQGTFRSRNLVGKTIGQRETIGLIFKREIVWHKTNSARAHFGTHPHPGGILLSYAHEFILEFEKLAPKGRRKYAHVTPKQREASKLDKEFGLKIKKSDVWLLKPEKNGAQRSHVAPFPYEWPARRVKAYSFVGETVLDPFLGRGTTLVAARDVHRDGIGDEVIPRIARQASKRLQRPLWAF